MSDGTPLGALLIDEGLLTDAQLDATIDPNGVQIKNIDMRK